MQKFTESVKFIPDPSIIKKYASFIIPLYLNRELKCDLKLIDEYLELNKSVNFNKSNNIVCDLEILACKNIFDDPTTQTGFTQLKLDIDNKCDKLEKFLIRKINIKYEF
jgi:hypothetical protein